jgi:hypothetical protein
MVVVDTPALPVLPEEFWSARESFQQIRRGAWSRNRSGDVALHVALARLSALASHRLRLDTGVGDLAVALNYFTALVSHSGGGKSSGKAVASRLLPTPPTLYVELRDDQPLGSGEGLAESFYGVEEEHDPGTGKLIGKTRKVVRNNSFFYCDEGQIMQDLQQRKGSTLGPQLRSAWSGTALGQANASEDRYRYVPAGSYSLGLVVGFQYKTVQHLLADADGGTPQRFTYVSATDPNIPDELIDWPGPLRLDMATLYPHEHTLFGIPGVVLKEIRGTDTARNRGQVEYDPLDSHEPLMRIKLAALLGLLENRQDLTTEDWKLAQVIIDTSRAVRTGLVAWGDRDRATEQKARTDLVVDREVRKVTATASATNRIATKAKWVGKKVAEYHAENNVYMTRGALQRLLPGRDRAVEGLFDAAVEEAIARGLVTEIPGGLAPACVVVEINK